MDAKTARLAHKEGKTIDVGKLLDLIERQEIALDKANKTIAELTEKLDALTKSIKLDQPYSIKGHESREAKAGFTEPKKKRASSKKNANLGRKTNDAKLKAAIRTEQIYPLNLPKDECVLSHTRPVWRLENNRAVIIAYEIWVHKKSKTYGKIPGAIGRGGYGVEFILAVAFQVYTLGLSLDKVVLLTEFFQNLKLGKSQIDAMLNQFAKHLDGEFDNLCSLVANSMILHADETSWSIHSVWALLTENARVILHGIHKDGLTLATIVDPAKFGGLVHSDHAAVYSEFSKKQKCWAHLLRKAIRICLLAPEEKQFELFRDSLFEIYKAAVRLKNDGRFSDEGRHNAVIDLQNRLYDLIEPECEKHMDKKYEGALEEYRLLIFELLRLNADDELFNFVLTASVVSPNGNTVSAAGTNNEAERTLRNPAKARQSDQASKSARGAKRRTVIVSVFESLRCYLKTFTLKSLTNEILSWQANGISCFERQLQSMKDAVRSSGVLDSLYPPSSPKVA
jgi:transposase